MNALFAALFAAVLAGCSRRATRVECDAVMDHYVEMMVREYNPSLDSSERRAQYERTRAKAAQVPSFADCPKQITQADVSCALRAVSVAELEQCLE